MRKIKRKFNFTKNELYNLYIVKGYGTPKIASIYGCSSVTVLEALKRLNIKIRTISENQTKYNINIDKLKELCNKGLLIKDIAKKLNCTKGVINLYIKKHNLVRDTNSYTYIKNRYREKIIIEPELLWGLYWGEELTIRDIANIFDCYDSTIMNKFEKYNIPTLSISESLILHNSHSGANNWSWKGGKSVIDEGQRKTLQYKRWRREVKNRDNWTCQICGNDKNNSKEIHAHHIKDVANYPESMFDLENGITLCKGCHRWIHHLNPIDFQ